MLVNGHDADNCIPTLLTVLDSLDDGVQPGLDARGIAVKWPNFLGTQSLKGISPFLPQQSSSESLYRLDITLAVMRLIRPVIWYLQLLDFRPQGNEQTMEVFPEVVAYKC